MVNSKKIKSYSGTSKEINIPTSINGILVREISNSAFVDKDITKITLDAYTDEILGKPWGANNAQIIWAKEPSAILLSIVFEKSHYDFEAGYNVKDTDFVVIATYSDSTTAQVQTACEYYVNGEKKDFKTGWAINTNGELKATYNGKEAITEIQNWI